MDSLYKCIIYKGIYYFLGCFMSEKSGKRRAVILEQLKKNSGDSSSAVAWRYLGGGFVGGVAVGTVHITPEQLVFALDVRARISEMVGNGSLVRRKQPVCKIPRTNGDGYWVANSSPGVYRSGSGGTACRQGVAVADPVRAKPASPAVAADYVSTLTHDIDAD